MLVKSMLLTLDNRLVFRDVKQFKLNPVQDIVTVSNIIDFQETKPNILENKLL